jgi:hypothetical protein
MRILITLFLIAFSLTNVAAQTATEVQRGGAVYSCERAPNEDARKVCTDKSALVYLKENFQIQMKPEKAESITCNWDAPITKGASNKVQGIVCENSNPSHKTLIGWVNVNEKYVTTLRWIGNNQLAYRKAGGHDIKGNQTCDERLDLVPSIKNAVAAASCEMILPSGEKLHSVVVFIQPSNVKARRFFVTVMNVSTSTSPEAVEKELVGSF